MAWARRVEAGQGDPKETQDAADRAAIPGLLRSLYKSMYYKWCFLA